MTDLAALTAELRRTALHRELQLDIREAGADQLIMRMPMSELAERLPDTQQFHGGALATLIDVAGDFVMIAQSGAGVPTINFRVDFLRPATGPHVDAIARPRRIGRTVAAIDVDVVDAANVVVAIGRGCYSSRSG